MHVAKVVDLFAKIPEQLSLHFSDFSTILNRFYKITDLNQKHELKSCKRRPENLHKSPWKGFRACKVVLGQRVHGAGVFLGYVPARELASGEGEDREKVPGS